MEIYGMHIQGTKLPFHHFPNALLGWDLVTVGAVLELIVMFKKPIWNDLNFMPWCIILL